MGYIAREFKAENFPQGNYGWYVFFLTSQNNTPTDETLINNFFKFAENIDNEDQKNLAIHFYNDSLATVLMDIYKQEQIAKNQRAIVISNVSPLDMNKDANE